MLSVYVGEEKFLKGVSIYLKKHLYANSIANDLWMGIQEATGMFLQGYKLNSLINYLYLALDIPDLMNNWILKVCYCRHTASFTYV